MSNEKSPSRGALIVAGVAVLAVAVLAAGLLLRLAPTATEFTLAAVEADVAQRFPMLKHLTVDALAAKLAGEKPPLMVDVRDEAEFRVSRIAGAERIAPDITVAAANARLAPLVAGREVVFYCSVGMRASVVATEIQEDLIKSGATQVYNLRGRLFAWHNAGRPLVNERGATDAIHPISAQWGKLLIRQDRVRMDAAP